MSTIPPPEKGFAVYGHNISPLISQIEVHWLIWRCFCETLQATYLPLAPRQGLQECRLHRKCEADSHPLNKVIYRLFLFNRDHGFRSRPEVFAGIKVPSRQGAIIWIRDSERTRRVRSGPDHCLCRLHHGKSHRPPFPAQFPPGALQSTDALSRYHRYSPS